VAFLIPTPRSRAARARMSSPAALLPRAPALAPARRRASARPPRRAPPAPAASSSSSASRPPYLPTWSNPTGAALTPLVPGLVWAAERPFTWNGIDVGGKMGVVKLADGSVWVHSPVELDAATRAAVDALGPVRHVVSPNYEHVKYAAAWKAAYPDATLYGCPGMIQKEPDIPWDDEVGRGGSEGDGTLWLGEFRVAWFDCERTPVVGGAFFNEVVFAHAPSGCAFVTDCFWNYPGGADVPAGTRAWKWGMDEVYLPFYRNVMVTDEARFETVKAEVLSWEWDAMVPCHGVLLARGGKDALRAHLG
jgi:hypothetical protein